MKLAGGRERHGGWLVSLLLESRFLLYLIFCQTHTSAAGSVLRMSSSWASEAVYLSSVLKTGSGPDQHVMWIIYSYKLSPQHVPEPGEPCEEYVLQEVCLSEPASVLFLFLFFLSPGLNLLDKDQVPQDSACWYIWPALVLQLFLSESHVPANIFTVCAEHLIYPLSIESWLLIEFWLCAHQSVSQQHFRAAAFLCSLCRMFCSNSVQDVFLFR